MQEIKIGPNEAGQRLDKFLHKLMPLAPSSFFYRMLRKKNITLNEKKAEGKEKLEEGDTLILYLSDDTINNFKEAQSKVADKVTEYEEAYRKLTGIQVLYEDEHILIMNKPAGVLSQKAEDTDFSLNEWMIGYLLSEFDKNQLFTYKPSVCNRLDRNTSGLVVGAKSLTGSQEMNRLFRSREISKYYRMFVKGKVTEEKTLEGYLLKDEETNMVYLTDRGSKGAAFIRTRYYPIREYSDRTLVEAELITGKSHQLRIHMASVGHPLIGDYKYGDRAFNESYKRKYHINSQLLYACRLEFPEMNPPFGHLSKKVFEAPIPGNFQILAGRE